MSEAARTAISSAADTVEGITCTPYFRQTTTPGDAMVRLDRMARAANGFGFVNTWQVVIVLPQNVADAEKWLDAKYSALVTAIGEQLVVAAVTPQELVLESGTRLPVVVIEGQRETD